MDNLFNIISAWGNDPNIFLIFLALSFTFAVLITILYVCVPFILLRIRKELIEMNKNLRTLYILNAETKIKAEADADNNNPTYPKKNSDASSKFQLDDDDIRKLKATGFDIE